MLTCSSSDQSWTEEKSDDLQDLLGNTNGNPLRIVVLERVGGGVFLQLCCKILVMANYVRRYKIRIWRTYKKNDSVLSPTSINMVKVLKCFAYKYELRCKSKTLARHVYHIYLWYRHEDQVFWCQNFHFGDDMDVPII
ncbi:hypothetical protein MTR_8g086450 [Medicago truncatula]|uniref:Uncharacterized protein n=1 Tax=Medicago truncatula TaxID=3880 RepID=G7LJE9_MEDTR|nr:hypothetical protein MTR_8g086450 [Medicago truncatula]